MNQRDDRFVSRRHFLRGTGGFTLALPLLPSLLPREALAADATSARPRRFIAMGTNHGGVAPANMYPPDSTLTNTAPLLTGHDGRWGKLTRTVAGDVASVSPVIKGKASLLTDRMVERMNVLRGLDVPFYLGHNTGGHLGNFARNNSEDFNDINKVIGKPYLPTIDQLMAWSSAVYPNLSGIRLRSIVAGNMGGYRGLSFMWSNPTARTGEIQVVRAEPSSRALFDQLFMGVTSTPGKAPRRPIVDLVLEDYKRTRDTHPRLGATDKQRLSDHMDRVSELQRRLDVTVKASCSVTRPTKDSWTPEFEGSNPSKATGFYQLQNEVIALAFICDVSRVATIGVGQTFSTYVGSWHQDIAHRSTTSEEAQRLMRDAQSATFESVFLDLARRLDVEEAPGSTILDQTLMQWSQESGGWTHDSDSIPIVTLGSAGGAFKTGIYADFRNLRPASAFKGENGQLIAGRNAGVTYNRWLATVLRRMGVPEAEWKQPGLYGYGSNYIDNNYKTKYVSGVVESADQPLPFVT